MEFYIGAYINNYLRDFGGSLSQSQKGRLCSLQVPGSDDDKEQIFV